MKRQRQSDPAHGLEHSSGRVQAGGGEAPLTLVAVWNTQETRHLVENDADPEPCEEDQENGP